MRAVLFVLGQLWVMVAMVAFTLGGSVDWDTLGLFSLVVAVVMPLLTLLEPRPSK